MLRFILRPVALSFLVLALVPAVAAATFLNWLSDDELQPYKPPL